jgi:hypothetical protein
MSLSYNNSILAQTISVSGSNNTSVTGVLTATSGNFTNNLQINGVNVSLIRNYTATSGFPASGVTNTYYISSDTSRIYQWTGSQYVETGPGSTTISANDPTVGLTLLHPFLLGGL